MRILTTAFRTLVVALAVISSACGGSTKLPNPTGPDPVPSPAPTPKPAEIKLSPIYTPENGATMSYIGPAGNILTRVRVLSYSLGDQTCQGSVWMVVGLTDRPGYFIPGSIDQHTLAELEGAMLLFRPSLKTPHINKISTTSRVVAYLICGLDIRGPKGMGPNDSLGLYGAEADFASVIMARDELEVTWHWGLSVP